MKSLVQWLSYSRVRSVSRVFSGTPPLRLEADPVVQERLIGMAERRVYGQEGLEGFEKRVPSRLARLAHRSLAQFFCQQALVTTRSVKAIRLIGFAAAAPFLLAFLLVRSLWPYRDGPSPLEEPGATVSAAVVFLWATRHEKFVWDGAFGDRPVVAHRNDRVHLGRAELRFMRRAFRSCPGVLAHPELLCHFLRWLAYYGYVVRALRPQMVANFSESTAASSLMTAYLAERGIMHCGIQHGEIVFSAYSAFAEFDEYRAWGSHFADILTRQRSAAQQVITCGVPFHRQLFHEVRQSNQPRPSRLLIVDPFLQGMDREFTYAMLKVLALLDGAWEVRIRRHPADRRPALDDVKLWNDSAELVRRGVRVEEECPESVPIEETLGRSRVVAGIASALLLEAWFAGCKVVYVPGGPPRTVVMDRHLSSPNVCYLSDEQDLTTFLGSAAELDDKEARRIHHVTAIR